MNTQKKKAEAFMTKPEVCAFLGKSKRTIEGYVKSGALAQSYRESPNGPRAIFERAAVEAFAKKRYEAERTPAEGIVAVNRPAPARNGHGDPFAGLAEKVAKLAAAFPSQPATIGKWLTLDEAADASGLPKSYLLAQARAGVAWAVNAGGGKRAAWRFRTDGLK